MRRIKQFCSDFFPEIMGVSVAIASLNIWLIVSIAIDKVGLSATYESIEESFLVIASTALGAVAGSYFTFRYNRKEILATERLKRINSIHKTIFVLNIQISELNIVRYHRKQYQYRGQYHKALLLPSYSFPASSKLSLNLEELSFLIEFKKRKGLKILYDSQMYYELAVNAVTERSNFYDNEIQPVSNQLEFDRLRRLESKDCREKLGDQTIDKALGLLKNMDDKCEIAANNLNEAIVLIMDIAEEIYPQEDFNK